MNKIEGKFKLEINKSNNDIYIIVKEIKNKYYDISYENLENIKIPSEHPFYINENIDYVNSEGVIVYKNELMYKIIEQLITENILNNKLLNMNNIIKKTIINFNDIISDILINEEKDKIKIEIKSKFLKNINEKYNNTFFVINSDLNLKLIEYLLMDDNKLSIYTGLNTSLTYKKIILDFLIDISEYDKQNEYNIINIQKKENKQIYNIRYMNLLSYFWD